MVRPCSAGRPRRWPRWRLRPAVGRACRRPTFRPLSRTRRTFASSRLSPRSSVSPGSASPTTSSRPGTPRPRRSRWRCRGWRSRGGCSRESQLCCWPSAPGCPTRRRWSRYPSRAISTSLYTFHIVKQKEQLVTDQEILAGLAEIIEEIAGTPADEVTPAANFVDDLDIDSLSMVEIAVAAQDKFGVEIPDEQLKDLKTVQDVVNFVAKSS